MRWRGRLVVIAAGEQHEHSQEIEAPGIAQAIEVFPAKTDLPDDWPNRLSITALTLTMTRVVATNQNEGPA